MNPEARAKVQARVKRITGQIAGIGRMVEEDRYCLDVLSQIAAVRSALDALGVELLHGHVERCILGHGTGSEHPNAWPLNQDELLAELRASLTRFLR